MNGFENISSVELIEVDGGVIPVALRAAYVALLGVGFTTGVTMGVKNGFRRRLYVTRNEL